MTRATDHSGRTNLFGDSTLVLDEMAESEIIDTLTSSGLRLAILSEERGFLRDREDADYLAVIDPVDGSTNVERGIPLCSAGVSLVHLSNRMTTDDVEVSVVRSFFTDDTFVAKRGEGVTRNGAHVRVASERPIEEAIVSYDTKKPYDIDFMTASARVLAAVRDMRRSASNLLDLCWTACGALDAMVDLRGILPIVHICGTHMVEEAGGYVINESGSRMRLPIDIEQRMSFIASSDRKLADEILKRFRGDASLGV
ncbi:MAG: hypothetical protein HXY34_13955 [Candidatus Thorarchaeota archaeon]|nr:hypothetical protein [Candidatus Thorarchaeota archaeon]